MEGEMKTVFLIIWWMLVHSSERTTGCVLSQSEPTVQKLKEGEDASFTCFFHCNVPEIAVAWYNGSNRLNERDFEISTRTDMNESRIISTLHIVQVSTWHRGTYKCFVDDSIPERSLVYAHHMELIVYHFDTDVLLPCRPQLPQAMNSGDRIEFVVQLPQSFPRARRIWTPKITQPYLKFREDRGTLQGTIILYNNMHGKTLTFNFTNSQFSGKWVACSIGPFLLNMAPRVKITPRQTSFDLGFVHQIKLICGVLAFPYPSFQWYCEPAGIALGCNTTEPQLGLSIGTGNASGSASTTSTPDEIFVTCTAANKVGQDDDTINIPIRIVRALFSAANTRKYESTVIDEQSQSPIQLSYQFSFPSMSVVCSGNINHHPLRVQWYIDGESLSENHRSIVHHENATSSTLTFNDKHLWVSGLKVVCEYIIDEKVVRTYGELPSVSDCHEMATPCQGVSEPTSLLPQEIDYESDFFSTKTSSTNEDIASTHNDGGKELNKLFLGLEIWELILLAAAILFVFAVLIKCIHYLGKSIIAYSNRKSVKLTKQHRIKEIERQPTNDDSHHYQGLIFSPGVAFESQPALDYYTSYAGSDDISQDSSICNYNTVGDAIAPSFIWKRTHNKERELVHTYFVSPMGTNDTKHNLFDERILTSFKSGRTPLRNAVTEGQAEIGDTNENGQPIQPRHLNNAPVDEGNQNLYYSSAYEDPEFCPSDMYSSSRESIPTYQNSTFHIPPQVDVSSGQIDMGRTG